jgi:ectoine hydroxylase-related dioxygenase (phytanoyl-CoA dioxygenase family)
MAPGRLLPALDGEDVAVAWITFEKLSREDSLEFARGSHKGTVYNASKFDPKDDTIPPLNPTPLSAPPGNRGRARALGHRFWPVDPGDVIFFHFRTCTAAPPPIPASAAAR